MTRKFMSMTTLGLVDFRSDKERTAAYARGTRNNARQQTKYLKKMSRQAPAILVVPQPQPWWDQQYGIWRTYAPDGQPLWFNTSTQAWQRHG